MHIHAFTQNKSLFIDVNKAAITNYSYNRTFFSLYYIIYPIVSRIVKKLQISDLNAEHSLYAYVTNRIPETVHNYFFCYRFEIYVQVWYKVYVSSDLAFSRDLNFIFRSHRNFFVYKKRNVTVSFNTTALRIVMISLSVPRNEIRFEDKLPCSYH